MRTTKIIIARFLFCTLGVLPLLALASWCAYQNGRGLPNLERSLSLQLGRSVQFQGVTQRSPTRFNIEQLMIRGWGPTCPPEAVLSGLDVQQTRTARWVEVMETTVSSAELQPLAVQLLRQLSRESTESSRMTTIHFVRVEIRQPTQSGSWVLENVRLRAFPESQGGKAEILLGSTLDVNQAPIRLQCFLPRPTTEDTEFLELICEGTPLPCSLLAGILDVPHPSLARCQFLGRIFFERHPTGTNAEIVGELSNFWPTADLRRGDNADMPLEGSLQIKQASFRNHRLEDFQGSLRIRGGKVRFDAVADLFSEWALDWQISVTSRDAEGLVAFDELLLDFHLQRDFLQLTCPGSSPAGAILVRENAPILKFADPAGYSAIPSVRTARGLESIFQVVPRFQ